MKIILEREKCIGCGSCEAVCPKYWKMGDDSKVDLIGSKSQGENFELEVGEADCNVQAAESCPVQCIKVQN